MGVRWLINFLSHNFIIFFGSNIFSNSHSILSHKTDENNKRRRELLKTYYGTNGSNEINDTKNNNSTCEIDSPNFDSEIYLRKLLKVNLKPNFFNPFFIVFTFHFILLCKMLSFQQKNLSELVNEEQQMMKSIRELDSDMQMLVYENYNKFISATDTIRKVFVIILFL